MVPGSTGESSKVKVKVRVNIHGMFNVSSATMIEKMENAGAEPMEVDKNGGGGESATDKETSVDAGEEKNNAEQPMEQQPTAENENASATREGVRTETEVSRRGWHR